jgi:Ca2+-binding RTX toxin-like protein
VNVNLHTGTATGGDAQGDTLSDIEAVIGSAHDDTVFGSDSGTTADLGAGNDTFDNNLGTSAQVDVIDGGAGNDTVYAGEGNDTLTGGTGDDVLWGEGGSDTFVFGSGDGNDFAAGGAGGGWTDAIQLQDSDGSAVDGGWTVTLTSGTQVSDDGSKITLSDDAEGTITLNDGSEIDFTGIENITY